MVTMVSGCVVVVCNEEGLLSPVFVPTGENNPQTCSVTYNRPSGRIPNAGIVVLSGAIIFLRAYYSYCS